VTYYYDPDLSAGSFRMKALTKVLSEKIGPGDTIDIVTTLPNRYHDYSSECPAFEQHGAVTIRRIETPKHKNGFLGQAWAFMIFFMKVLWMVRFEKYDLVFATTSRLFTGFLGAVIAAWKRIPFYLDIRDIFVDTIKDVMGGKKLFILLPVFSAIERFCLNRATKVNLVSQGFMPYFEAKYSSHDFAFFPNGIDEEFLEFKSHPPSLENDRKVMTYAGNIGEGQGLSCIIEKIAHAYPELQVQIIGGGNKKAALLEQVRTCENVSVLDPVPRKELLDIYVSSDFLFLHLNDYEAFKKVLPSKLFEYAAMRKPIIAGVAGYARDFIKEHLPDVIVFEPCNIDDLQKQFDPSEAFTLESREAFVERFSRTAVMQGLSDDILSTIKDRS
jgi:glycosyltransferase involved in cell wall biosynthesis